ncbi:hypothetical protein SHI21_10180 [Bacteriovorax sp. PP10]|uniref:Lipocalin-like domain-containing protein n=1 Tax=Bacteriovorax antarcticus TaxID=3088717 RepID=A0ABU5VU47_9BACT|nr:hypothetical protein [Bacteriovorax sp. PP10]MEA9356574.1 hypothetical protein [Bacteriovorax sp. PP10]
MKAIFTLVALAFSINAFACPNITGKFFDADSELVRTITQNGCVDTTWSDEDGSTTLIADNVERVLESEGSTTAYAKVSYTVEELVVDIRMDWGGHNDFDLPVRWLTSYRVDKFNNLVEKIIPFKEDGSVLATEFITYRRVK